MSTPRNAAAAGGPAICERTADSAAAGSHAAARGNLFVALGEPKFDGHDFSVAGFAGGDIRTADEIRAARN